MVGLETLQFGKSRDEEPWKVGTNIPMGCASYLDFDLEKT